MNEKDPSLVAQPGSKKLLARLFLELREKIKNDSTLRERLRFILRNSQERERFTHWLNLHQRYAAEDGEKSALISSLISSITSSTTELDLDRLISNGLGLVFIRYNPATQESYYHYLRCDLLADSIRDWVAAFLSVPRDQGSIGGVVGWARQWHHASRRSSAPTPFGLSLYSCFLDPRGRVATEDLAIGNRAWIATPVFADAGLLPTVEYGSQDPTRDDPLGVLFAFFPIDGVFHSDDGGQATELPFVNDTLSLMGQYAPTLAYHLTLEAFAARTRLARKAAIGSPADSLNSRAATALEQISALVLADLVPNSGPADDAAGFILAITDERTEFSSIQSRIRDRTFFDRLFQLLQLACLYPREWLPGAADALRRLSSARAIRESWQPVWLGQDREDAAQFAQFYPKALRIPERTRAARSRLSRSSLRESFLGELYRDTLDLYGAGHQVVDLAVPLMDDSANLAGYIRINCRVLSWDSAAIIAHQSLYSWVIGHLFQMCQSIAAILCHLDNALSSVKGSNPESMGVDLGILKSLVDFRYVLCQLAALHLAQCLSPLPAESPGPVPLREIVTFASRILEPMFPGLAALLEGLLDSLDSLSAPACVIPPVLLISVWSTAPHFVIASHNAVDQASRAPDLDQIFLSDSGLPQLMSYLVSYVGGRPSVEINIGSKGRYEHRLAQDPVVLPVIPDILAEEGAGFLELWVRRSGKAGHVRSRLSAPSQWMIEIDWEPDASPLPIAYALCPGVGSLSAFAEFSLPIDNKSSRLVLSRPEDAGDLRESLQQVLKLAGIFRSTRSSSGCVVRLEVLPFPEVPGEDLGPTLSFGTPSMPRSQPRHLALLTLALGPEPEWLWTLRDVALRNALRTAEQAMQSAQTELWRTLQAIVQSQRESLRALRHQLSHDLARFREQTRSAAAYIPASEYSVFLAQVKHFHLLIEYLVGSAFHSPLRADVGDIVDQAIAFWGHTRKYAIVQSRPGDDLKALHLSTADHNVAPLYVLVFNLIKNAAKEAARHPSGPGSVSITYPEVNAQSIDIQIANSGAMEEHYFDFLCGRLALHPDRAHQPEERMKGLEVVRYIAESFGFESSFGGESSKEGRCAVCRAEGSPCHGLTVLRFRIPRMLFYKKGNIL